MHKHDAASAGGRPDIARAFAHLAKAGAEAQQAAGDPIAGLRCLVDRYGDVEPRPAITQVDARAVDADGVGAEWLVPARRTDAARVVYLHGGGWVAGGLSSHRAIAAALSQAMGAAVLLVDYRLAPEHPFPAGLEDCEHAFDWAGRTGPEGDGEAACLHIVGDSAGANLAAAVCRRAIARGRRVPDRLALLCAVLDGAPNPARMSKAGFEADAAALAMAIGHYARGAAALTDPDISPIHTPLEELRGFPECLLQVSSSEYLSWDSRAFAERLAAAERRVLLSVWPALPHVWHAFLDLLPEARLALQEVAGFLASKAPG